MPKKPEITFHSAAEILESALCGSTRREIASALGREPFERLLDGMRSHSFRTGEREVQLARVVNHLDRLARADGFHVLHDWDGKADRLNDETIPVDVLTYRMQAEAPRETEERAIAILIDYYFFYLLALLSLRAWDEGDSEENLDCLGRLLEELQGPGGSGHRFVTTASCLVPIATSHYEPDETAYDRLLVKVRTLPLAHRTGFALVYASILASHLRFGFEATYGRDVAAMRKDNAPDYPSLSFALSTLMESYSRGRSEGAEPERIVEALLNGLTPDPRAFVGAAPPASLAAHEEERSRFAARFAELRTELLAAFESHRPSQDAYSPLSFFFNFPHNLVKGAVVDSVLRGSPWTVSMEDLLTGIPRDPSLGEAKVSLAAMLMGYARSSPDTIRGRPVPAVVYDPRTGARLYREARERLRGK